MSRCDDAPHLFECHCQIHIQRVFVLLRRDHDLPLRPAEPSGRDDIAPTDSGKTNAEGYLYFPTGGRLTPGLYLVLGQRHIQNGRRYDHMPFMVMLPTQDTQTGDWLYEVIVDLSLIHI